MVKKVSYIVISAAILIAGYFAFTGLNYWERSIRIFKIDSQFPGLRGGFPHGGEFSEMEGFEDEREQGSGFQKSGFRERPDSTRINARDRSFYGGRAQRDSLNRQFSRSGGERFDRGQTGNVRGGEIRHGDRDFRNRKKVSLGNVGLFLVVFAAFAVAGIYADKVCVFAYKRVKS